MQGQQLLAMKTQAVQKFMLAASAVEMGVMSDLIGLGFGLTEWTTDHDMLLAERVGMGKITKEQKIVISNAFGEMAAELTEYHSQ